jgi:hypothetical protein
VGDKDKDKDKDNGGRLYEFLDSRIDSPVNYTDLLEHSQQHDHVANSEFAKAVQVRVTGCRECLSGNGMWDVEYVEYVQCGMECGT